MLDFDQHRWDKVVSDSEEWWTGTLNRPLVQIRIRNVPSSRDEPALPFHFFQSFYDLSIPATDIIDVWDYQLSCTRHLGDSFPHIFPNLGPGVIAAFLGCVLENGSGTTWFHPKQESELDSITFAYDKDNIWLNRINEIMYAAIDKWHGFVQIDMTDLGGNLDILSSFRPGEKLLYDLYDNPASVKKLTWQAHDMWWTFFQKINSVLQSTNPGYTAWCPIFSTKPYYILQCDFSYMIGPDMFEEFVKPELVASCNRLENTFYHLDGPGQLRHLDSLLSIPQLKGIQWVPGAGAPDQRHWPDVYRKIHHAGKLIQIYEQGSLDILDVISDQIGCSKGIIFIADVDAGRRTEAEDFIRKWYK